LVKLSEILSTAAYQSVPGAPSFHERGAESSQPAALHAALLTTLTIEIPMGNRVGRSAIPRPRPRRDYRLDVLLVVLLTLLSLLVLGLSVGAA